MELADLRSSDIGREVAYKDFDGSLEWGVITSYNELYVFVQYGNQKFSQGTSIEDLVFAEKSELTHERQNR